MGKENFQFDGHSKQVVWILENKILCLLYMFCKVLLDSKEAALYKTNFIYNNNNNNNNNKMLYEV